MAGGKLEVQIGADKSEFDKKIKEIEFDIKELSKVKLDRLKLGLDTTEINNQIKDAKNSLNSFKSTVKDTGNAISGQFTKQVGNGGNTLMQFSRIAQDAPFGIMGIGNNITATAESFSYLKQQTGSTGGALKALASSIAGTGGILLGVSLLTTGLTLLSQSGLSVQDVINKLTGNFDEFGASVKKSREEGANSASKEIEGLRSLIAVAKNDNIEKEQRLIAVDKLQKQFPYYYANLSAEKIMYGDLTAETKEATKALIARATAEKFVDKAANIFAQRLQANGRYLAAKQKLEQFDDDIAKKRLLAEKQKGKFLGITNDIIDKQLAGRASLVEAISDERDNIIALTKTYERYVNIIDKLNEISAPLTVEPNKDVIAPRVASDPIASVTAAPLMDANQVAVFTGQVDEYGNKLKALPGVIRQSMIIATQQTDEGATRMAFALMEFNKQINDLIQNSIATTFADLGNVIGNALATGGDVLSAIGGGLIQSLGSFLSALADKLITYGLLLAGFGKAELAFKVGDAVTKIGAGIAMVALGIAAKTAGAAVSSFGGGGGRTSAGSGSGANNQSFTSSGFGGGGQGGGTVVFEIAGTKLIGVLSNTINANRRLGGQLGLG